MFLPLLLSLTSLVDISEEEMTRHLQEMKSCTHCDFQIDTSEQRELLVFMSLSIPKEAWVLLSKEVQKAGGAFVLRGLPGNSFHELALQVKSLKEAGVNASIQIHPKHFEQYNITQVPTFVVLEDKTYDKITGHLSLKGALEIMSYDGETKIAKDLLKRIRCE